jgi:hypothetical protein
VPPLVYIAGPYTRPDPVVNTRNAVEAASALYATGLVVPVVPHLTMLWHLIDPQPVEFWYGYDLHILRRCDAVFVLPGSSVGADNEVTVARELSMPVFETEAALLDWARLWS